MNALRKAARFALDSAAWKRISRFIRNQPDGDKIEAEFSQTYPQAKVVVYFGDAIAKIYQLHQWLPVLEELNNRIPVVIMLRRPATVLQLRELTSLPIVLKRKFRPMMDYIYEHNFRLVLYVNNSVSNFQMISFGDAVHVHINHGESDKVSMVSNQAKAYDRVFVAGEAAIARHHRALVDFDFTKLVKVGRPQLDFVRPSQLPATQGRTVMYAPTWEGENDANNYTSVDVFGRQIVKAVLSLPQTRLIYKPHPQVEQSADPLMVQANQKIYELIESANSSGGDHQVLMQGDILGMFSDVDLLITDVSGVGLDFLYLHPDKPLILTDRRNNAEKLALDAPVATATPVITSSDSQVITSMLSTAFAADPHVEKRTELRNFYFGTGKVGASSEMFFAQIQALISDRDTKLQHTNGLQEHQ